MANIINGVSRKVTYTASTVKLNSEIKNNEREIDRISHEIGRQHVINHIDDVNSEYEELFVKIRELQAVNKSLNDEIQKLKEQQEEELLQEQEEKKQRQMELARKREEEELQRQQELARKKEQEELQRQLEKARQMQMMQQLGMNPNMQTGMNNNMNQILQPQAMGPMKVCAKCGKSNEMDAKFCVYCGNTYE